MRTVGLIVGKSKTASPPKKTTPRKGGGKNAEG